MQTRGKKHLTLIAVAVLAMIALPSVPAMAKGSKNEKKLGSFSSAEAAAEATASEPNADQFPVADQRDKEPGPAWKTVGGTVKHIKGNTYTVEDYDGNQIQLYVGQGTKQLRGHKKVGDTVRAEITRGGFANSIQ
jgi:hypothetical protein